MAECVLVYCFLIYEQASKHNLLFAVIFFFKLFWTKRVLTNFLICRVYRNKRRGFGCGRRNSVRRKRLKRQRRKRRKMLAS